MLQKNPRLADGFVFEVKVKYLILIVFSSFLQDPRMIDVLGVAMGIDMQGFSRPEGSEDLPQGYSKQEAPASPPQSSSSSKPKSTPAAAAPVEEVEMEGVDDDEAAAKREAEASKKAGSEAYKKRDFSGAAKHYQHAWDTWPKDITYLTNLGGEYSTNKYQNHQF